MKDEILEVKKRVEEFEQKYREVGNESKSRLEELEGSRLTVFQLQETIERLEVNLSTLKSENQVLSQQASLAAANDSLYEETAHLRSLIKKLQSENEFLRNNKVVEEGFNPITTPEKSLDNGQGMEDIFDTPNVEQDERRIIIFFDQLATQKQISELEYGLLPLKKQHRIYANVSAKDAAEIVNYEVTVNCLIASF
nr:myosin-12-like isoform X2 [Tanacetum cinerariifolium]